MNRPGYYDEPMNNLGAERVREVSRLATKSGRAHSGEFLAEGPQAVREALRQHLENAENNRDAVVNTIYATDDCLDRYPEFEEMAAKAKGVRSRVVSPEVLAGMADTVTPQGIVAVCRIP
ncbi:MAG: RNA methyltransferase substrate-binding domain-containing protein, partial [Paeniglutamicibacter terrestris]